MASLQIVNLENDLCVLILNMDTLREKHDWKVTLQ